MPPDVPTGHAGAGLRVKSTPMDDGSHQVKNGAAACSQPHRQLLLG